MFGLCQQNAPTDSLFPSSSHSLAMIRPVEAHEIPLLCQVAYRSFYDTFIHSTTEADMHMYTHVAFSEETQKAEFENPNSAFYFMEDETGVFAYLKLNFGKQPYDGTVLENPMEIQRLYMLHSHIGKGIGERLMQFSLQEAQNREHKTIWLGVWEYNERAQAFYRRFQFTHFGETAADIGNTPQTDWLWKRDI